MAEYIPTTEEIRDYVEVGGEPRPWMPPTPEIDEARAAAFDRWLAEHDREVRAVARADVISEIRWLADARAEYSHVESQVEAAHLVADILAGDNDAAGWLPSWKWFAWAAIREGRDA